MCYASLVSTGVLGRCGERHSRCFALRAEPRPNLSVADSGITASSFPCPTAILHKSGYELERQGPYGAAGSRQDTTSNRNIVAGTFRRAPPALVVNLGGGDVRVAEEVLKLADIEAGVQEQRGVVARRERGVEMRSAGPCSRLADRFSAPIRESSPDSFQLADTS